MGPIQKTGPRGAKGDRAQAEGELSGRNRIERSDPEGSKGPEGEWRFGKKPEVLDQKSGHGSRAWKRPSLGANQRMAVEQEVDGLEEGSGRASKKQAGNFDPAMVVRRRTVVVGERKAASRSRLRAGITKRRPLERLSRCR